MAGPPIDRPIPNGCTERFNGKLKRECLNAHWFQNLHPAGPENAHGRHADNEVWPRALRS
jgi:glycine cleavage system protein P-like pyridoxal-binding family